jgi:hypothetical protein
LVAAVVDVVEIFADTPDHAVGAGAAVQRVVADAAI